VARIDFPIVSVASVLTLNGSTVKQADGSSCVAPVPLRATNVEEALVGKPVNERTAEMAGAAAARRCSPLEKNRYKVQILKGLIRKAILGQK